MAESYEGMASLSEIQVNEDHWGPGSEPIVKAWLAENYNPETMPKLAVATIQGREGLWLLGWSHEDTDYPPLLELIFGEGYAEATLAQVNSAIEAMGETVLCPRCGIHRYTPAGRQATESAPFPALSRMDNRTHICTWCGTDEAMRELNSEPPLSPDDWPIIQPGAFGQGRL